MRTLLLWSVLTGAAWAQDSETKVRVTTDQLDLYAFKASACEGVRAEVRDDRPAAGRTAQVLLELTNTGESACSWTGLVLKGWLAGMFQPLGGLPDNGSFSLAPGEVARFRVKPADLTLPRGHVQLQIPPGRGYVVFVGVAPEPPPPAEIPAAPQPAP